MTFDEAIAELEEIRDRIGEALRSSEEGEKDPKLDWLHAELDELIYSVGDG